MGDLISRSALLELFKNLRDEHETNSISYNALYEVILQQPTAYDVEAVVDELEKHINLANRTYERFENNTDLGRVFGFETAISIVRGKE